MYKSYRRNPNITGRIPHLLRGIQPKVGSLWVGGEVRTVDYAEPYQEWHGLDTEGFHKWGTPKWMVYNRKSQLEVDDLGEPLFQEPPIYIIQRMGSMNLKSKGGVMAKGGGC